MFWAVVTTSLLGSTLGSTPITLAQVRSESRQNTQALVAQLERDRAAAQTSQARSSIFPQVQLGAAVGARGQTEQTYFSTVPSGADAAGNPTYESRAVDIPGTSSGIFELSAGVSQLLLDGGKWWNRMAQAKGLEASEQGRLEEQQMTSEFEGIRRFYDLYRAQKQRDVLDETYKRSREQESRALALFQAGRTSKAEYFSAQVNAGNDQVQLIKSDARIAAARALLAAWLLRPPEEDLSAVPPDALGQPPVAAVPPLTELMEKAKTTRPLIVQLEKLVSATESGVAVARGGYFPALTARAGYLRAAPTAGTFGSSLSRQNAWNAQLSLSWDLFNGFSTVAQVREADLEVARAKQNLTQARAELGLQLKERLAVLETQSKALGVTQKNRDVAAQSLVLSEQRFQVGAGSTLEVRDAQLKLTQAELNVLETRVDVELARADLHRVTGQLPQTK